MRWQPVRGPPPRQRFSSTESYSGLPDFRQKFGRQLAINLNSLLQKKLAPATTKSTSGSAKSTAKPSKAGSASAAGVPSLLDAVFTERKHLSPEEINDYVQFKGKFKPFDLNLKPIASFDPAHAAKDAHTNSDGKGATQKSAKHKRGAR